MKMHKKLTAYLGICGYFTNNFSKTNKEITCKECIRIIKKESPKTYLKRTFVPF
jgi:hypothetical protein